MVCKRAVLALLLLRAADARVVLRDNVALVEPKDKVLNSEAALEGQCLEGLGKRHSEAQPAALAHTVLVRSRASKLRPLAKRAWVPHCASICAVPSPYEKVAPQWPTCAEIDSMKWPVGGLRVELRPATSDRVRSEDDALAPPTDQFIPVRQAYLERVGDREVAVRVVRTRAAPKWKYRAGQAADAAATLGSAMLLGAGITGDENTGVAGALLGLGGVGLGHLHGSEWLFTEGLKNRAVELQNRSVFKAEGFAETLELRPDGVTGDAEWAELVAWLRANLAGEGQVFGRPSHNELSMKALADAMELNGELEEDEQPPSPQQEQWKKLGTVTLTDPSDGLDYSYTILRATDLVSGIAAVEQARLDVENQHGTITMLQRTGDIRTSPYGMFLRGDAYHLVYRHGTGNQGYAFGRGSVRVLAELRLAIVEGNGTLRDEEELPELPQGVRVFAPMTLKDHEDRTEYNYTVVDFGTPHWKGLIAVDAARREVEEDRSPPLAELSAYTAPNVSALEPLAGRPYGMFVADNVYYLVYRGAAAGEGPGAAGGAGSSWWPSWLSWSSEASQEVPAESISAATAA